MKLAGPAIEAAGGRFIARGEAAKVYEAGIPHRTTLIEFESLQAAVDLHDGPAYQAALKALDGGADHQRGLVNALQLA